VSGDGPGPWLRSVRRRLDDADGGSGRNEFGHVEAIREGVARRVVLWGGRSPTQRREAEFVAQAAADIRRLLGLAEERQREVDRLRAELKRCEALVGRGLTAQPRRGPFTEAQERAEDCLAWLQRRGVVIAWEVVERTQRAYYRCATADYRQHVYSPAQVAAFRAGFCASGIPWPDETSSPLTAALAAGSRS
jgi:hypothetical protein